MGTRSGQEAEEGSSEVTSGARSRGRPRNPNIDRLILQAAWGELKEHGYAKMAIDKVALRAGLSKPAIYLRFPNKESLAIAALGSQLSRTEAHRTGDLRADLNEELAQQAQNTVATGIVPLIGTLLAEINRHPKLLEMWREQIVRSRVQRLRAILEAGQESGELRKDIDLIPILRILVGVVIGGFILGHPVDPDHMDETVDVVLNGAILHKH